MLVDNGVDGDSRVQKAARSAAEAGWEVTLIGKKGDSGPDSWRIGDAEVRLVPVSPEPLEPWFRRGRSLRRPLAYPPGKHVIYRLDAMKAWRTEIVSQVAQRRAAQAAGSKSPGGPFEKPRLLLSRVGLAVASRWVRFRARESRLLREARNNPRAPMTRFSVWFWSTTMGERCWRRLDPALWQWELSFGKVVDGLKPDLIHAHDFKMVGVAARAVARARAKGRAVKFVWDAHEYVPGLRTRTPGWLEAQAAYEREYAPYADAVMTVSDDLANLLRRDFKLAEQPVVVLNAPVLAPADSERGAPVPNLRELCGIGPDTPLLAYSGGITPVRGVDLIVDALASLPDVHVAMLSVQPLGANRAANKLRARAAELGVADRVHLLPYVPHWQVSKVLSGADAAVSPLHHLPNHEIALSNKFFEYSHARLPLVVSDVRTMAAMVRTTGQGEVFKAEDLTDFVRAVKTVLADPERYRAAYDRPGLLQQWSWEAQAEILDQLYTRLLPQLPGREPAAGGEQTAPPASALSAAQV
ncbi:glycosyltransferase family 4 protein [Micromonospora sp. WMMD1102]|uniref:glycosyltransferase family 4 protein n=1 Tax=Micromonospora sp. WMMD1102 TaxID=3016105 RepID=UPI0024152263|nr:glycosyltransferase family 4 protein [Micromonospora sp. WMMD1102]MDG4786328.1 glycosyltransferase family 4 protein [Micromonospora sp. WMMD1102]